MKRLSTLLFLASLASGVQADNPATVDYVDIKRYMGLWYEIARYPNRFQKGCLATTAEYALRENGTVNVANTCRRADKASKSAEAIGFIKDKDSNAKLAVSFVPLLRYWGWFAGDYWILALGDEYEYALVGDPKREYLWILSKTPTLPQKTLERIEAIAKQKGYDPTRLQKTPTWEQDKPLPD